MPYHIDEENSELAFEVREGNKLVIKIKSNIFSDSLELYLIKVGDNTEPTDKNVFSSLRVLKEIENLHDTILKEINSVTSGFWELKQDSQGNEYIATKYNVLTEGGLTTYGLGEQKLGTIYDGLPIDNQTIYWEEVDGSRVLKSKGGEGSTGLDETKLWSVLGSAGNQQINPSHLTDAFNKFNNDFVTTNTEQTITAIKHFSEGLSVGSSKKKIYEKDGVLYIDSSVAITGALTMYATDGQSVSSIYDGLPIDNDTIYWETVDGSRVLKAKGSGGEAGSVQWGNISGKPTWIEDTKPTYNWYEIQGEKPFYTKEEVAAKFVTIDTEQEITALKHFTAGLSVGESKKKIYEENGVVYIDADVAVTGAMTFYASAGRSVSTIMDGVTVDEETITKGSDNVLRIKNAGAGSSFDENAMWSALSGSSDNQINKSHLTNALAGYATESWVTGKGYATESWVASKNYATTEALNSVSNKLNDFLEGSDTDTIINKWKELEAFLSGMAETDNLSEILKTKADRSYVDSTFVTLATKQTITGEKTFSSVLNTAAIKASGEITTPSLAASDYVTIAGIKLRKLEDGALMLEGNLALTGALTMYASNGQSFDTIYNGLPIDNDTIYWQEVDGSRVLKAREGSGSSFDKSAMWTALAGSTTEQINKSHLTTALTGYATESWVSGKNYAVKATTLAGYGITDGINAVSVTGTGNAVTAASISGHTLTLTKGATFNNYTHPTATATTITAANGKVLSAITVNNQGHVTSVSGKTLAAADIPTLEISKISGLQDSLDAKLESSAYTAADVLAKLKTVDGSNSGLDADLLDGTHKTGLFTALASSSATNISITVGGTTKSIADLYANSAAKLETARTVWGQSFDGTKNITGALTSVTDITGTGTFSAANLKATDSVYVNGIRLHKTADGVITLEGNLAVTGGVTMYAIDPVSASTIMDGVAVDGTTIAKVDGVLKVLNAGGGEAGSVAWGNITGKPSVFSTNIANITDLHSSWDSVLAAQKPAWLTAVSIATISDLNSGWDALLKAAPSAYVTRWPTISEVTNKQNLIVKLNGGTTEGTNQFTYNATGAKTINITPAGIGAAASSHNHSWSNITSGKPTTLAGYGITDAYTKMDADSRYVNASGDTMTGNLKIQMSSRKDSLMLFQSDSVDKAGLHLNGSDGNLHSLYLTTSNLTWKGRTVWDSGNDGSGSGLDADLLDGTHKSGLLTALTSSSGTNISITVGGTTKSIADLFANSAAKLETARTIWGQSFDGTKPVTGALTSVTDITGTGTFTGANLKATDSVYVNGIRLHKTADGVITLEGNLAVTGGVTMYAVDPVSASTVMDGVAVDGTTIAKVDGVLKVLNAGGGEAGSVAWGNISGKPSVFATNIANITDLHSSWDAVLKAQKPNWLTAVSIATISDLHANWDALLKAAPSAYVTRWPTISEVTGKQNLIVKLNGGTTEGTNQFTYNATGAKTINITPAGIGAAASSHSHNAISASLTGTNALNMVYAQIADNDYFRLRVGGTASNVGYVEFATADDGNDPIYFRQYTGTFKNVTRTLTLLDGRGNSSFPGTVTAPTFNGNLAWSHITSKPTTLAGYGITDGVNSVSITGGGNAITSASISGHSLTLTKGSTFLLSSQYTAADVLAKLKTVDGAGSDLEADILALTGETESMTGTNLPTHAGMQVFQYYQSGNGPTDYGNFLRIRGNGGGCGELFLGWNANNNTSNLWYKSKRDVGFWGSWRQVAFTDMNVASATKLQTAQNIWGQSFDGTNPITGSLSNVIDIYASGKIQAERFVASYMPTTGLSSPNFYSDSNAVIEFKNPYHLVSLYTIQPILRWGNVINGYGYQTKYLIGSVRDRGGWGGIYMAVSNNDAGTSTGCSFSMYGGGYVEIVGNLLVSGGGTFYSSDIRYKSIMQQVELSLLSIAEAPSFVYRWNRPNMNQNRLNLGGSAQYTQSILPWAVEDNDNFLSMDYATVAYTFAVHTARHLLTYETRTDKKIKKLESRVKYLEKQLKKLGYEEAGIVDDQSV